MLGHNLLLLWIFTLIGASSAVLVNRTVDDGPGDSTSGPPVQYAPEIAPPSLGGGVLWRSQNNCDGCDIKPVNSDAESGTWTAIGYYPSVKNATATIEFQGSAIYIYLILANYPTTPDIVSSVHCNFRLDGEIVGNYSHPTDGSSRFEYNALAYANTSLPNANHTILLEITGPDPSYLIFDYAEYTFVLASSHFVIP
ncbi:hypothetical protein BD779DRAFT_1448442 [Infundibulicybe gibba]|nr:hypothetical protein BD779DRAFT_1448442 [Infundibulicybe gibba]